MLICKDCGAVFEEPATVTETHGFTDVLYEQVSVCPDCGSTSYVEAVECDCCGKWYAKEDTEVTYAGEAVCPDCLCDLDDEIATVEAEEAGKR